MKDSFENYYAHQAGHGMPVFTGARYQRGYGLGHVVKGLFRSAVPLLKKAGSRALKSGMETVVSGILSPKAKPRVRIAVRQGKSTGWTGKRKQVAAQQGSVTTKRKRVATPRTRKARLAAANFKGFSPIQSGSGKRSKKKMKRVVRMKDIFYK